MGFKHLLRRFLSHFVDCPLFGVENVLVAFPGDGRLSSPPSGIIIVCSGVRAQQWSVRLCSLVRGSKLVYCCFYLYGFQYAVLSVFFGTAVSFPQGDHLKVCSGFVLLFGFRSAAVC